MISSSEFYYFNKMLDGKEIYGVVYDENLGGGNNPRTSLISKRILEPDGKMNKLSSEIFKSLDKYKKAKDYIWINDSIAAVDKTENVVYLRKNKGDDYTFRLMSKSHVLNSVIENYNFLMQEDYEVEDDVQEKMTIKVFLSTILNKKDMSEVLYIKKEYQKIQCIYNIYYEENNIVYRYDVLEKIITKMSPKKVLEDLMEIFNAKFQLN